MSQLEENIMHSFKLAKNDIMGLQDEFLKLSQTQERLMEVIGDLKSKELRLYQRIKNFDARMLKRAQKPKVSVKVIAKRAKKLFLASKAGSIFHQKNCPFAQNIKPKMKLIFKSKTKALNNGFKPCKCVR